MAHHVRNCQSPLANQKCMWSELELVPTLNEPNLTEIMQKNQSSRLLVVRVVEPCLEAVAQQVLPIL